MNKLIYKFLSFSSGTYIGIMINFFLLPLITRILTPEEYGIYSLFMMIVNMIILVSLLGLDQGYVRYYYEENDISKRILLKLCMKKSLMMVMVCVCIIYYFREKISLEIFLKYDKNMIICLILLIIFSLLNRYILLNFRMEQKAKRYSFFQCLNQILNLIVIFILLKKLGKTYTVLIYSNVISMIIVTALGIVFDRKIWIIREKKIKVTEKELLKYSLPFTLTMILTWLFQSSDKIMIKIFFSADEVGLYAAAFKIASILNIIQNGFTIFWVPIAYERYSNNKNDLNFFECVFEYVSFIMMAAGLLILIFRNYIIILLGNDFNKALYIMPCLILMPILYTVSEITVLGINFKKKTRYHMKISIIIALLNILGNIFLIPHYGAKGAAISTGMSYLLFFFLRTYYSLKEINFKFNLKRFYKMIILIYIYAFYLSFDFELLNLNYINLMVIIIFIYEYRNIFIKILFYIKTKFSKLN